MGGVEADEETEKRNARGALEIATIVRGDAGMHGRIRVHMRTTGSHAKKILLDANDGWLVAVGSCNWLSSLFQAVELSVVVRDHQVIADLAVVLQRMVGRRGLADGIANEMALTARDLRRSGINVGNTATMSVVVGDAHERIIRMASGEAKRRFFVGSNRLGSTARPGAIMQGELAAACEGVQATVLYAQNSGPLKNRHARAIRDDAASQGVRLVKTRQVPLHGKVVTWDDDDVVVTGLNWASAPANPDFPWAEIGIHIHAPNITKIALDRLLAVFSELEVLTDAEAADP